MLHFCTSAYNVKVQDSFALIKNVQRNGRIIVFGNSQSCRVKQFPLSWGMVFARYHLENKGIPFFNELEKMQENDE